MGIEKYVSHLRKLDSSACIMVHGYCPLAFLLGRNTEHILGRVLENMCPHLSARYSASAFVAIWEKNVPCYDIYTTCSISINTLRTEKPNEQKQTNKNPTYMWQSCPVFCLWIKTICVFSFGSKFYEFLILVTSWTRTSYSKCGPWTSTSACPVSFWEWKISQSPTYTRRVCILTKSHTFQERFC